MKSSEARNEIRSHGRTRLTPDERDWVILAVNSALADFPLGELDIEHAARDGAIVRDCGAERF